MINRECRVCLFLLPLFFVSCSPSTEVKRIGVWPIYENWIVFSAIPKFIEKEATAFGTIKYDVPKSWRYENASTGEKIVTWNSSTTGSREKMVIVDSGFHEVSVPLEEAAILSSPGDDRVPTVLVRFRGTNTAFTPDAVDLLPIDKLPARIQNQLRELER